MKLDEPLTDQEIDFIESAVARGGSLGLYRRGEGDEKHYARSLLEKMISEFRHLRGATR